MTHNFSKPRHAIVPNRTPLYKAGDRVTITSTQRPLDGKTGIISAVYPAQKNVFYKIIIGKSNPRSFPERMIKLITQTKGS